MLLTIVAGLLEETSGLYFPAANSKLLLRIGALTDSLANLTALLYSGRPAPAMYSLNPDTTSDVTRSLKVGDRGTLSWRKFPKGNFFVSNFVFTKSV